MESRKFCSTSHNLQQNQYEEFRWNHQITMQCRITSYKCTRWKPNVPVAKQCPDSAQYEDGHHVVQNQKRSNTSISTKREVVLADRAQSSQYSTKSSRVVMPVTNTEDQFRRFNQNVCFWHQIQIRMYHFCSKSSNSDSNLHFAANRPEKMIAVMKLHQLSWNHSKYRNEYIPR